MTSVDYTNHPCPECGHKIGLHTNSSFGNNPLNSKGEECSRSQNSLAIEKLTAWLNDALSERDAYMKSYEDINEKYRLLSANLNFALITLKIIKGERFPVTTEEILADDCINIIEKIK